MTQFRPCIDLHQGKVKQIVGGSLNDQGAATNFISQYDAAYYADIYRQHDLRGGHVIALGPNNETEVLKALKAWPQGLQFGGGVNLTNATKYIAAGASHVIVTSYLFDGDEFSWEKLAQLKALIGKEHLILDLSCRKTAQGWNIATNRWQTITSTIINADTLTQLSEHCAEFLIHAADVEGLQNGIDQELVTLLGRHTTIPVTYAGGARSIDDLVLVDQLSKGKVDLTIGSALDIFGGSGITLQQCIDWNQSH
ncbi:phosphoribosylformimino-5-aminoimidazole carboxamide ribotide isomerase [Moritella viscosa]|uniref:Probable phosphoribosylformimino-5-aminoimidazole carboxamideribotide isomerase n=1 Tax=Moritella viscosa TaxID=80854 RepID=A0ABY1HJF3_9GAMM|nr:phosphoribosylformimino-5-aminoimidazole carboxamide ribotide isomerase [Moritella viscosa]SGY92642.1 Probable phosphoribosylformimino-5-aminoimidazole carboxamideribotide isomerase [Moritella viscosa]SGZ02507.1 Probable phosphoribosylformimino-5-aminoimidazole carboxamideribotide isomerase [Moritella viscosa]SHO25294.1 Probable phosphoribosylformimino-5-aminoimidazole carboxamideribotide isomerase [Moritella viscosa]